MSSIKRQIVFLQKKTVFILLALIFFIYNNPAMTTEVAKSRLLKDIPDSSWQQLSQKIIYFGHQSVGNNIMEGARAVIKEKPQIKLSVVESADPAILKSSMFAHSSVGRNKDPYSKINAFSAIMDSGLGGKADYAFLKLCFVDITENTDIEKVFNHYKTSFSRLKERYPKTVFIHFTVPLMTVQKDLKVWIKKIVGKPIGGYADNEKRNQFNDLVLKEFGGKEPIFDLAAIESGSLYGTREFYVQKGKKYYALVPEYTNDGGHLNETARKIVAEQLLLFLAELSAKGR